MTEVVGSTMTRKARIIALENPVGDAGYLTFENLGQVVFASEDDAEGGRWRCTTEEGDNGWVKSSMLQFLDERTVRSVQAHEPDGTENTVSSKASDRQDTAEAEQHRKKPRGRAPNDPATGKPKVWTAAGWKTADEAAACVPPQPQPKGIAAFFQRAAPTGRSVGTPPILLPASKSPITHESGASGGNAAAAPTSTPICLAPRLPTLSGTPTSSASPS